MFIYGILCCLSTPPLQKFDVASMEYQPGHRDLNGITQRKKKGNLVPSTTCTSESGVEYSTLSSLLLQHEDCIFSHVDYTLDSTILNCQTKGSKGKWILPCPVLKWNHRGSMPTFHYVWILFLTRLEFILKTMLPGSDKVVEQNGSFYLSRPCDLRFFPFRKAWPILEAFTHYTHSHPRLAVITDLSKDTLFNIVGKYIYFLRSSMIEKKCN